MAFEQAGKVDTDRSEQKSGQLLVQILRMFRRHSKDVEQLQ